MGEHFRKLLVVLILLCGSLSAQSQTPNQPIGNRDGIVPNGNTYFTWGWTCDPDNWSLALRVDFYVDGTWATGTYAGTYWAGDTRNDVAGVCNGTVNHGYDWNIPYQTQFFTPGTHTLYAYAWDDGNVGPNPLLGGSPLSYQVFTISGNAASAGATVSAGGYSTTADAGGNYTLSGFVTGTFTVTPSQAGCTFSPASQNASVGPNATGINFSANCAPPSYSILGNAGVGGATLTAGGNSTTADGAGNYSFNGLAAGTYTVSPSLSGCTFSPGSQNVTLGPSAANVNFSANCPPTTYTISGRAASPGATVAAGSVSTTADANGGFVLSGLTAGTYAVTVSPSASDPRCTFSPNPWLVSVGPSAGGVNFTATCERSWDPGIHDPTLLYYYVDESNGVHDYPVPQGRNYWAFSSANEVPVPPDQPTWPLSGTPYNDLGSIVNYGFAPKGDGTYKFSISLDKTFNDFAVNPHPGSALGSTPINVSSAYTTAFFEDNFDINGGIARPSLGEELYLDFRMRLVSSAVGTGPQPVPQPLGFPTQSPYAPFPNVTGMSRVTVGINTQDSTGQTRVVEIVLWRDNAYDACVSSNLAWWGAMRGSFTNGWQCDTNGLFDRRISYGLGENAYFYGPQLNLTGVANSTAPLSSSMNSYSIPLTALVRYYFDRGLSDYGPPSNWATVSVRGLWLGIETWGQASASVELDNYRLYTIRH